MLLEDIQKLPRSFWIVMTLCSLAESAYIPFLNNANKLYQYRFGFDNVSAGNILVIPYLSACIFTPFVGIYMTYTKNRSKYILLSAIWFLATHVCFATISECDDSCLLSLVPLVFLGFCFAVFASVIMPSIPIFINDEQILGTAFGIVAIFQNLLLSVFPLLAAIIFEQAVESTSSQSKGFLYVQLLFVVTSSLMVVMGVILLCQRAQPGKKVQLSTVDDEKKNIVK